MVTFVRTNYHYQPYDDFFALVEASGYPIITVDKLDPDANETYIITPANGEWREGWQDPKAQIIWWDLEWVGYIETQRVPRGVSRIWASCPHYARTIGAEYVMLAGVDIPVTPYIERQFDYDVALMQYREPHRRAHVIRLLQEQGLTIAPDGWGAERDSILARSRLMVHIHQHDYNPSIAPIRFALAGMAQIPLISEAVANQAGYNLGVLFSDYPYLHTTARILTQRDYLRADMAKRLHRFLCVEHTFRGEVEKHV